MTSVRFTQKSGTVPDEEYTMPTYRISAEIRPGRKTVAYRRSKGDFSAHIGDAQLVPFNDPKDAGDWLRFTWRHFQKGWTNIARDPIWKGSGLDNVRLTLEEIAADGSGTVTDTTADWDGMTVTSGGATS
jgi:hypothetical protein